MLDEIPLIQKSEISIPVRSKIVCYTDGLSELKDSNDNDIGTGEIIRFISNTDSLETNISSMMKHLGIPDTNPSLFDDVSVIAADLD
jgi:hypothetical protein